MSTTHKETVRAWFQNMKEPAGAHVDAAEACGSAIAVAGWAEADGGILLGDIDDALDLVRLRAAGVTHIINCAARPLPPEGEQEDNIDSTHPHLRLRRLDAPGLDHYTSRGVELAGYLAFAATDSPTYRMADHFDEACRFIDEARAQGGGPRRVLVHCQAGVSRSASVVLCYLMRNNEWTLRQAIEHVWQTRPFVLPNAGFFDQLLEVERQLFAI
ncbi:dual specificity phosphatase, catalytic domain containing protein [Acanthamoeba castellanii str. Neff]|uniref:protein-tyrosine-phosphatase n=1 Tax=Acanthamoeba castellanii (strain ATCC 30010 / Neff) TaxID=1257118 RepID=L8GRG2_ACACF|nr:dual specificity phosphatase, catalytic domain containing protein [Acanthamoeba castellanii str. Neff]ELR15749.1 dual specificity phosphatase, catalytic domain containing protein [Acanthamoeba castellanii str. Neff]